jgi:uncharacterized membrane protein YkoI
VTAARASSTTGQSRWTEAVAQAERRYKARAVKAEEKRHGDRVEYRIRLLGDDGRVFEVRVDATTGRED